VETTALVQRRCWGVAVGRGGGGGRWAGSCCGEGGRGVGVAVDGVAVVTAAGVGREKEVVGNWRSRKDGTPGVGVDLVLVVLDFFAGGGTGVAIGSLAAVLGGGGATRLLKSTTAVVALPGGLEGDPRSKTFSPGVSDFLRFFFFFSDCCCCCGWGVAAAASAAFAGVVEVAAWGALGVAGGTARNGLLLLKPEGAAATAAFETATSFGRPVAPLLLAARCCFASSASLAREAYAPARSSTISPSLSLSELTAEELDTLGGDDGDECFWVTASWENLQLAPLRHPLSEK